MKIAFLGRMCYADTDICLLHHLQEKGIDVTYFMEMSCNQLRATLFDIKKQNSKCGVLPASEYKEFLPYKNYIDLSRVYIINRTHKSGFHPTTILLWIKLAFFLLKGKFKMNL